MINIPVTLPVEGQHLAQFILSLLGQRRTIERNYDVAVLFVKYDWVLNTVALIDQRISQNISSMASFRALYYYENGAIRTVNTLEDFQAFHDNSQEKTVGIDIFMTYLVKFPHTTTPEKQDIRLEIFADIRPREFLRPIGRIANNQRPLLKYTIYSTNVTWGEDLSSHLDRQYDQIIIRDKLAKVNNSLDRIANSPALYSFVSVIVFTILMWAMFNALLISVIEQGKFVQEQIHKIPMNVSLDIINRKLDVLLQNSAWGSQIHMALKDIFTAEWLVAVVTLTVLAVLWRVIRKHTRCYFVAFNEFTTVRLQRMIKVRDYVMWAVVVAFGIGVIASVAAARVDKFLFG